MFATKDLLKMQSSGKFKAVSTWHGTQYHLPDACPLVMAGGRGPGAPQRVQRGPRQRRLQRVDREVSETHTQSKGHLSFWCVWGCACLLTGAHECVCTFCIEVRGQSREPSDLSFEIKSQGPGVHQVGEAGICLSVRPCVGITCMSCHTWPFYMGARD